MKRSDGGKSIRWQIKVAVQNYSQGTRQGCYAVLDAYRSRPKQSLEYLTRRERDKKEGKTEQVHGQATVLSFSKGWHTEVGP